MYKSALIYTGKGQLLFSLIILKKILIAQFEGCQKLTTFVYGLVSDKLHFHYGIQSATRPGFTQETPLKTEVRTVEKWPEREQEMGNRCWGQVWAESSLSFPWLVVFRSLVRLTAHYTPLLTFSYLTSLPAASQAMCLSLPLCFLSLLTSYSSAAASQPQLDKPEHLEQDNRWLMYHLCICADFGWIIKLVWLIPDCLESSFTFCLIWEALFIFL